MPSATSRSPARRATASARFALRDATRGDHDRVDALFSRFALDDRAGYTAFLLAQADALLPLEAALTAAAPADMAADWRTRRRGHLLVADLAELDAAPSPRAVHPPLTSAAAAWGVVYVLEGSRLGGAMLERTVPPAYPRRFLGAHDPASWRSLAALLDGALAAPDDLRAACDAAAHAFDTFARAAHQRLEALPRE